MNQDSAQQISNFQSSFHPGLSQQTRDFLKRGVVGANSHLAGPVNSPPQDKANPASNHLSSKATGGQVTDPGQLFADNSSLNQTQQPPQKQTQQLAANDQCQLNSQQKITLLDQALSEVEQKKKQAQIQGLEAGQLQAQHAQSNGATYTTGSNSSFAPSTQSNATSTASSMTSAQNQSPPTAQGMPQAAQAGSNSGFSPPSSVDSQQTGVKTTGRDQAQLNPPTVSGSRKEGLDAGSISIESGASLQYVEQEKSPEIPPEVEKYIQKVDQDQVKPPQEVVIADQKQQQTQTQYAAKPVIVLPITPEIEKKGKGKPPKFSVRWLVEWSKKIIKMFSGKVIYRQGA